MKPELLCPACGSTGITSVVPPYGWPKYDDYFRCECESLFVVGDDSVEILVDTYNVPDCPLGWDVHGYGFVVPLSAEDAYFCTSCRRAWYSSTHHHLPFVVRLEDGKYLPVPVPPSE